MENERESVTQTRVRLYRKALDQLREENELKEARAQSAKEPNAQSQKEPEGSGYDLAHRTADERSDKA